MIRLTEEEKLGIKIVANYRSGELNPFKCENCNAGLKEIRDCDGSLELEKPVTYVEGIGELYACPNAYIPQVIVSFFDKLEYCTFFNVAPKYEDCNPRFWEATKFYNMYMAELALKHTEGKTKNGDDNASKMAALFPDK